MTALVSPTTGEALRPDSPHSLTDGRERWPLVDGIPYLRTGRESLAAATLADLDRGDRTAALVRLLADPDDWWDGPPPRPDDLLRLVREAGSLTLRDAMGLLGYGRVGDYFAHRWSDPTFLAGLALVEAHWTAPRSAFELACGIGHHLDALARTGIAIGGGDVVFSKLWLARHWVLSDAAELCCFDAAAPWPVRDLRADLVLCQDAFYFLEPKDAILAGLRRMAGPAGTLAIGHIHNSGSANLSAGAGVTAAEIARLFPDGTVYDDDELTRAAASGRAPEPRLPDALGSIEAFSVAVGPAVFGTMGLLTVPAQGTALRRNPLYEGQAAEDVHRPPPAGDLRAEGFTPSLRGGGADDATHEPAPGPGLLRSARNDGWPPVPREGVQDEVGGWPAEPLAGPRSSREAILAWPSERYRREYAGRATYPPTSRLPDGPLAMEPGLIAAARRREVVALPERW